MPRLFTLLILITLTCLHPAYAQTSFNKNSKEDSIKIDNVLDKVLALPEVVAECKYVEKASKGTRHLDAVVYDAPSKKSNYYWVKVWEDNGMNYVSHFNFFVTPKTLTIKYLDTVNDTLLDMAAWRRINRKAAKGKH